MANQDRNGRNVAVPEENQPSWRPQDDQHRNRRNMNEDDRNRDREWSSRGWDRDEDDRNVERYGQGQSGYAAGRVEGDRSYGSRNQAAMSDWDQSRDRGSDDRFVGGRGGPMWSPSDRNPGMYGSSGNYGHTGHWTDDNGGGYLGQSGQQMGYGDQAHMGRPYGQGTQNRYGGQGYQGYGQYGGNQYGQPLARYGGRMIGEQRYGGHPGQHGYGYHPEHDMGVRSQGYDPRFDQPRFDQPRGWGQNPYAGMRGIEGSMFIDERMEGRRGGHRGKGPAGYTRSDERIREMVCDVLTDHDEIDASQIEVAVRGCEVTLSGTVENRRTKRLAEDVIDNLSGVKEVVNQLRVSESRTQGTDGGPAVEQSGREQALQSGASGNGDKRHRA